MYLHTYSLLTHLLQRKAVNILLELLSLFKNSLDCDLLYVDVFISWNFFKANRLKPATVQQTYFISELHLYPAVENRIE